MPRFDPAQASCRVYTRKEGALSALGHDLELSVERFTIDVAADRSIDARFDAASLRVRAALVGGRATAALSPSDRDKIERTIVEEVLDARRHPQIHFTAGPARERQDGYALEGELALHGARRPITVQVRRAAGRLVAEVVLHQPDFGIRPYRAMLGALRVAADVRVCIELPDATAT